MFRNGKMGSLDYKMLGLSMPGKTHINNGTENQDSYGFFSKTNSMVLAVADGVGSCINSLKGAKLAIETVEKLHLKFESGQIAFTENEKIKEFVIGEWKRKIEGSTCDYSSTLQFVTLFPNQILRGGIGDGCVFIKIDQDEYVFKSDGELFTNWTHALNENINGTNFEITTIEVPSGAKDISVCVATDGITSEILDGQEINFLNYCATRIRENAARFEKEISDWFNSLQAMNGDDKTLLLFTAVRGDL